MKFVAKYFLIYFVAYSILSEVQGESDKRSSRNENEKDAENVEANTKGTIKDRSFATPVKSNCIKVASCDTSRSFDRVLKNKQESKIYSTKSRLRVNKSDDIGTVKTAKDSPVLRSLSTQKIYCRQITKTEVNNRGDTIETIQHICAPSQTPTAPTTTPFPYADRGRASSNMISSTAKGINCRRVMNSELNELGEIIDSVTEVCDTPTTTTTTKKPTLSTTPKFTTTTAKPLVKVCWPVMDSYLNEEGKIIDSVSTFCKMQPVN